MIFDCVFVDERTILRFATNILTYLPLFTTFDLKVVSTNEMFKKSDRSLHHDISCKGGSVKKIEVFSEDKSLNMSVMYGSKIKAFI